MSTTMIHYLNIELELIEPGAVLEPVEAGGFTDGAEHLDMRPSRDHEDRWTLPATSVAGSIRNHLAQTHPLELIDRVMGFVRGDEAGASSFRILGTRLVADREFPGDVELVDEHSTAIDRHRGAAANRTLRHMQVLPEGSRFEVFVRWDDPERSDLEAVLSEIGSWRPFLGAGVSSGHGACRVVEASHGFLDLSTSEGMLAFLTSGGPELVRAVAMAPIELTDGLRPEQVVFSFEVTSALHVGTGQTIGKDPEIATVVRRQGIPMVSGRSLKGVFRSRSEFILRSLGVDACETADCGCCEACTLFGHHADVPGSESVGLRSCLRFLDAEITDADVTRRSHIAIDRFTGGVTDGALFTEEVVDHGRFEVRVDRLRGTDDQWELATALLVLVAQDLNDGFVGIGGATTRGQGTVQLVAQTARLAAAQRTMKGLVRGLVGTTREAS